MDPSLNGARPERSFLDGVREIRYRSWATESLRRALYVEAGGFGQRTRDAMHRELERRGQLAESPAPRTLATPATSAATPLGGALYFIAHMLGLYALVALFAGSEFLRPPVNQEHLLKAACWLGFAAAATICATLLLRRNQSAPRATAALLIICLGVAALWNLAALHWANRSSSAALWVILQSGLGLAYLWRSERVRLIYRPPDDPSQPTGPR
jgi:hypothetical protein